MKQRSSPEALKNATKSSRGAAWFVASALLFSAYYALQIQFVFADTNPPQVEPPSGTAYPTFDNLETKNDIVVGQNLKVGNTIKPKSGLNLTLDADKVNFKKDLETLGSLVAGNDVLIGGKLKPKSGDTLEIFSPSLTSVSGGMSVSGKLYADGGLVIKNGLKVLSDAQNPISLANPVLTGTVTADNISVSGKADINGALDVIGNSTLNNDLLMKKNGQVWGTFIVGNSANSGVTISSAETILRNDLTVHGKTELKEDVTINGKLKANTIGKFTSAVGKAVSVSSNETGEPSYAKCPAGYAMLSCSIGPRSSNFAWQPSDKLLGNAFFQGPPDLQTCVAYGSNLGQNSVVYAARVTCFSPSEN
jgi:cytoskeletal protein CcmA (bactofilin family)